jgi:flagellar hook-associated protein 3 FlgL
MRLSSNQIFKQGVDSILDTQERLTKAQDRLTNQTRLLTPSDDPAATAQVMRLNEKIELTKQYETNASILTNHLNTEEVALESMKVAMNRVKVLAIQAGSGSLSDSDRKGISFEIDNIKGEIFDLMNTRNASGDFIFAGFQSSVQPFVFNSTTGKYDYKGDEGELKLQVSSSVTLSAGDNGKKLFEDVDARLIANNLTATSGTATATVESQASYDAFHTANFDPVTPANNTYRVIVNGAGNYDVQNAAGTSLQTGAYDPVGGIDFQGLNIGSTGMTLPGTVTFDLSTPEKKNILTTLHEFQNALGTGGGYTPALHASIKDTLTQIENAAGQVAVVQASLGGRLNVTDRILDSNIEINHANQKTRSDLAEIDYAEAVTDLMKEESALEAAQATFGRVSRLSLFDFIS